jgi:hypothetical protein
MPTPDPSDSEMAPQAIEKPRSGLGNGWGSNAANPKI